MNANNVRPEPPDLSRYVENRSKFPLDELAKYGGKHIAFNLDATRIVASGDSFDEVAENVQEAGIPVNQVVFSYVDSPDVDGRI